MVLEPLSSCVCVHTLTQNVAACVEYLMSQAVMMSTPAPKQAPVLEHTASNTHTSTQQWLACSGA